MDMKASAGRAGRPVTRMAATVAAALAFVALPTSASAGTLAVTGDVHLRYTAAPGERNDVTVTADGAMVTLVDAGAPTVAGEGCTGGGAAGAPVTCSRSAPFVFLALELGDEADTGDTTELDPASGVGVRVEAGRGADLVHGGAGADNVLPGNGADRILGGAGNDSWAQDARRPDGGDFFDGGAGHDSAQYDTRYRVRLDVDGRANDGGRRERDNIADVETAFVGPKADDMSGDADDQIFGEGDGDGSIRGRAGADRLFGDYGDDRVSGGDGDDFIEGGPGRDVLLGGSGDDVINAKKGTLSDASGRDRVDCGPGEDAVVINRGDRVRDCERVQRAQPRERA